MRPRIFCTTPFFHLTFGLQGLSLLIGRSSIHVVPRVIFVPPAARLPLGRTFASMPVSPFCYLRILVSHGNCFLPCLLMFSSSDSPATVCYLLIDSFFLVCSYVCSAIARASLCYSHILVVFKLFDWFVSFQVFFISYWSRGSELLISSLGFPVLTIDAQPSVLSPIDECVHNYRVRISKSSMH